MLRTMSALVVVAGLSLACSGFQGQPVPPNHQDLVGNWQGGGVFLSVSPSGSVRYERHKGISEVKISGPVQEWKTDAFVVGMFGVNTTFHIDVPPHPAGSGWETTIDGVVLTR